MSRLLQGKMVGTQSRHEALFGTLILVKDHLNCLAVKKFSMYNPTESVFTHSMARY